jgi:hypothetical protein
MNRVTPKPLSLVRVDSARASQEAPDATAEEALAFADVTQQLAQALAKRPALDIDDLSLLSLKGAD